MQDDTLDTNKTLDIDPQNLDKELTMAQIDQLKAETAELQAQTQINLVKANAEISKMMAETAKIHKETKYYPAVSIAIALIALVASILALMK